LDQLDLLESLKVFVVILLERLQVCGAPIGDLLESLQVCGAPIEDLLESLKVCVGCTYLRVFSRCTVLLMDSLATTLPLHILDK
jgi:hypothetical protein